jgi:hypothetical protein
VPFYNLDAAAAQRIIASGAQLVETFEEIHNLLSKLERVRHADAESEAVL